MNNLVSIIIPTFNCSRFISETIESIINQTYKDWECVIVDDHSTDNTYEIIEKYTLKDSRIKLCKRPDNLPKGANACRNFGFYISNGEYINWFDGDDIMLENFISEKIKYIDEGYNLLIASGFLTNEILGNKKYIELYSTNYVYREYVMWRLKILTPSILFKKKYLLEVKDLFNLEITKGQEHELFSRIFFNINDNKYKIINRPTFLYRGHQNSSTYKNLEYNFSYKESEVFTLSENLKRSIQIKDNELVISRYRLLINLLKKAIQNKHEKNIEDILKVLESSFYEQNKMKLYLVKLFVFTDKYILFNALPWQYIVMKFNMKYF